MYAFQMCPVQKDKGDKSVLHMEYLGVISENKKAVITEETQTNESAIDSHTTKRQKRDR